MKDFGNVIGLILLIALTVLLILNWQKVMAFFGFAPKSKNSAPRPFNHPTTNTSSATTSEYDDCVKNNSLLAEGASCISCEKCNPSTNICPVPFKGVIVNGVCTKLATIKNLKVTNQNYGARVHSYYPAHNGMAAIFVPLNSWISFNTVIPYTDSVSTVNNTFYKTERGWVSATDITTNI